MDLCRTRGAQTSAVARWEVHGAGVSTLCAVLGWTCSRSHAVLLILSYLILSYLTCSRSHAVLLILSDLIVSYLILHVVEAMRCCLSYLILSYLILAYLSLSYLILHVVEADRGGELLLLGVVHHEEGVDRRVDLCHTWVQQISSAPRGRCTAWQCTTCGVWSGRRTRARTRRCNR